MNTLSKTTRPPRRANQRGNRTSKRRAFALLDAMIGGILLGIGLSVVLSIGTRSLNNLAEGERRLTGSWLADETLTMILVEGPNIYPKLYDMNGTFDYPFDSYHYDIDIDMGDPTLPAQVVVVISWPGARAPVQIEADIAPRQGDIFQPRKPLEPIRRQERWDDYREALEEQGL